MRQEVRLALVFLLAACDRSSSAAVPDAVVDAATVSSCTISYACGLSHPGLGSSSRVTSIDFATCTKTTSSESGPFESTAPRNATKATSVLSAADCARVRTALVAVTPADARAAQESAHIDSEACSLTLQCKGDEAGARLRVQRQTTTGPSRVERLIRAVLGMAP